MTVVLRIVALATGRPTLAEGQYVLRYTPDGYQGAGELVTTRNVAEAKRYEHPIDAMRDWKRVSATHPTRLDGKPNRPMTAFTVTTEILEDLLNPRLQTLPEVGEDA